ncbi:10674_t:CDS:2 [Acaulospora morrowiae]|uniref:Ubiquitin carboxyl-terminal hydrolase n=1 Tax=Acaulospora morrowiae TaxID=94023 RepID=A0A9N9F7J7_9GLOM|nr:10674_t:CDS:2 [Acaulospora morrowiae]
MSSLTFAQLKRNAADLPAGNYTVKQWLNSVRKLLDEAKSAKKRGDPETVYVCGVRASTIILKTLPNHVGLEEALKDTIIKTNYQKLKDEVKDILTEAENAAKILQGKEDERNRSEAKVQTENMQMPQPISSPSSQIPQNDIAVDQKLESPPNPELSRSPVYIVGGNMIGNVTSTSDPNVPVAIPSPLKDFPPCEAIQANQLRKFLDMREDPPSILVLDVRNRAEFDKGHIKTKNIVCLEPFLLKDGISSIDIEARLSLSPKHERDLFSNRHAFDLIVYHDQDSVCLNKSIYNGNVMHNLFKAITETEFKKRLPREPVLLNGGFKAWVRLVGNNGIECNDSEQVDESDLGGSGVNIPTRDRKIEDGDRSKRSGLVISDESSAWIDSFGDLRISTSPQRQEDIFNKINNNEVISLGRSSYITSYMDFYSQLSNSQVQSMTGSNYANTNNYSSAGVATRPVGPPNKPLPQKPSQKSSVDSSSSASPNSNEKSNTNSSGTSLKRRLTIFDHPYHGFSVVENPEFLPLSQQAQIPPPPKPKRPLPQTPIPKSDDKTVTNEVIEMPSPQQTTGGTQDTHMAMSYRPEQIHHASENSFSQLGYGIGSTGLKNLGNTCFMNSVIQCLSGTVPFARYFLDGSYKRHINKDNPFGTKGVLTEAFATLIRAMWSENYTFVSPVTFKDAIGRFAPQFSGSDQHDSQEFLAFLLDEPHVASGIEWEKYLMRDSSVVVSLFQGQFRNRLTCMICQRTSTTYNAFMYLSLPIPQKYKGERIDLETCLKHFVKEEVMEGNDAWHCPRCNCRRRATKQLTISRLPDVLLIHLKRFSFDGPFRNKLETMVDFPLRNLDLTTYVPAQMSQPTSTDSYQWKSDIPGIGNIRQTGPFVYDLYAVSNHYGGLNGGHYTACVRNGYRHEWRNFDDSRVSMCDMQDVKVFF